MQSIDETDRVLQTVVPTTDNVHVHLDLSPQHSLRIKDAILPVHAKVLTNDVNHRVVGREVDRLGVLDDILNVRTGDFPVRRHHRVNPGVVETADVAAGDTEEHRANLDVRHLFRLNDGVAHILLGQGNVDDLPLADAPGFRLAKADDVDRLASAHFPHGNTHLGGANLEANDNL